MSSTKFSIKEKIKQMKKNTSSEDFYAYLSVLKEDIKASNREDKRYDSFSFKALTGDPEAVSFYLSEINKYMSRKPFSGSIPDAYQDQSEAIFHEWIGFGPAYRWFIDKKYANSPGMQIIGTNIFIDEGGKGYRLYEHKMHSMEQVDRLKRVLSSNDKYMQLDHSNPAGELKMNDPLWPEKHIRLAIWVEPRVWNEFTTITMRRQTFGYMSLNEQAGTGSIPHEAIKMLRSLFMTYNNTIVAGAVKSGKSTFANTIVGEQLDRSNRSLGVVMIEKHPESTIPYIFRKKHRIIPVVASDDEVTEIGIESLRHDPEIVYLTEMRYHEWSLFLFSSEKGHTGMIGTYHTDDEEEIPFQAAMACHSKEGNSLKSYILTASKACQLTLVMKDIGEGRKRLTSVSEIYHDISDNSIKSNAIMQWDEETDTWSYNDNLSEGFIKRMNKNNKTETLEFLSHLSALAEIRRIHEPVKASIRSQNELK